MNCLFMSSIIHVVQWCAMVPYIVNVLFVNENCFVGVNYTCYGTCILL
jgi:hypothetical protein